MISRHFLWYDLWLCDMHIYIYIYSIYYVIFGIYVEILSCITYWRLQTHWQWLCNVNLTSTHVGYTPKQWWKFIQPWSQKNVLSELQPSTSGFLFHKFCIMICIQARAVAPYAASTSPFSSALFTNKAGIAKWSFKIIERGRRIYTLQFNPNVSSSSARCMGSNCWQALQAKRKYLLTFLRKGFACVTERPSISRQGTYVSGILSLDLTVRWQLDENILSHRKCCVALEFTWMKCNSSLSVRTIFSGGKVGCN